MPSNNLNIDWSKSVSPVLSLRTTVPRESREEFFAHIKKFGEANDFHVRIAKVRPDNEIFAIDLWRQGILVSGENVFNPLDFDTAFYVDRDRGGSADAALKLVKELESALSDVPGITIARTK